MQFPTTRMRRLRKNAKIRDIVRETKLDKEDLIYPIYFKEELNDMEKVWIGQVEAENNTEISAKFNINAYPTFILLKNGIEVDRFSGYRKKEDIMDKILKH
jgi:delta-aminolevulinic acid dehydratase/porphobilinogen synthase